MTLDSCYLDTLAHLKLLGCVVPPYGSGVEGTDSISLLPVELEWEIYVVGCCHVVHKQANLHLNFAFCKRFDCKGSC